jgi:hypothetical protein
MNTESEEAKILADRVLDRPYADPDDDLAILARQYLRAADTIERITDEVTRLRQALRVIRMHALGPHDISGRAAWDEAWAAVDKQDG